MNARLREAHLACGYGKIPVIADGDQGAQLLCCHQRMKIAEAAPRRWRTRAQCLLSAFLQKIKGSLNSREECAARGCGYQTQKTTLKQRYSEVSFEFVYGLGNSRLGKMDAPGCARNGMRSRHLKARSKVSKVR